MADLEHMAKSLGLPALLRRVRLIVGRGTLHRTNDAGAVQTVQAEFLKGEVRDAMERAQNYGFTSHPHPGAEPVAVFLGGDRSNGLVVVMNDRTFRLKALEPGEVAIYDDLDQKVHLTRTGIVVETPLNATVKAGKKLRLEGEDIELHATRSLSWDVAGFGERWTWTGGTAWEHKTWQISAVVTAVPLPINPPEGP